MAEGYLFYFVPSLTPNIHVVALATECQVGARSTWNLIVSELPTISGDATIVAFLACAAGKFFAVHTVSYCLF